MTFYTINNSITIGLTLISTLLTSFMKVLSLKISQLQHILKHKTPWRKHPIIRQYDQFDCGPAALLSILKYYGGNASLVYMRGLCQADGKGSSMLDLINAAKTLGFDACGATGVYEDLMKENMPCIAHVISKPGLNHFIVIYKINSKELTVGDPGKGRYKIKREEFIEIWRQKAVVLLKPEAELYNYTPPSWLDWIIGYLKTYESWVYQTLFLGMIYTTLGLLTAVFVHWLIDRFIPERDFNKIIYTGLFLLFLLLIRTFVGYFRQRFLIVLNKKINIHINSDFLRHIFRIPRTFFDTRKTGDITARINDSMKIQQAVLVITNTTFIDGLIITGSFILMFYLSSVLAWISLVVVPIYGLILVSKTKKIKSEQNEVMKGRANVESSYIDSLRGIDEILGFYVAKAFTRFNKELFRYFQARIEKLGYTQAQLFLTAELSGSIITMSLLSYGAILVIRDKLLLGQMMAAYSLLTNILPAIARFVEANIALQGANIAAQRLRDILLVQQEMNSGTLPFRMKNRLSVLNGVFSWPRSKDLFRGLSLSLEKGKLVSLWGRSGTGKSTLVQILQRKYYLSEGQILVDEIPAELFNLEGYRKAIAVVPQEIKLFNKTIIENITVGRKLKSIDDIMHRISCFGLESFVSMFDQGLYTLLGEDNRKLSGGEMQLLALIRALIDHPEVLIIDEGFSAMDVEIENLIFNTLKEYVKDHAVMIITHNLRTISLTDFVYILANGSIAESGKPEHLLQDESSHFRSLIRLQEGGKKS